MSEESLCSSTHNCTDKGAKIEDGTEQTSIGSIRVKGVSDINEIANNNINDIGEEETAISNGHRLEKRKLPPWMLTQVLTQENGEIPSKRVKTAENGSNDSNGDTSNQNTNNENERINGAVVTTTDNNTTDESPSCSSNANKNNNSLEANCVDEIEKETTPSVNTAPESEDEPSCSSSAQIKSEPVDEQDSTDTSAVQTSSTGTTNPVDIKPPIKVEQADATSTSRESCKYGIRCYRRNTMHRIEEAHPGDADYTRPNFPPPPKGTPDCPYGNKCYRRNPAHFLQFNHPSDNLCSIPATIIDTNCDVHFWNNLLISQADFARNFQEFRIRLRQRQQNPNYSFDDDDSSLDEYDLDDPFLDDSDLDDDYVPSDDDIDNDDDGVDGDKAEE